MGAGVEGRKEGRTDASADEGEEERSITGNLRWDLEFCVHPR
jgi:hypothetical protein